MGPKRASKRRLTRIALRLSIGYDLFQWSVTSRRMRLLHSAELFLSTFTIGRDCRMLIPLRHENMEGRRWPVVTFALIALNLLIFLGTHWKIEAQEPERLEVRTRSEEHTSELQSQSNL